MVSRRPHTRPLLPSPLLSALYVPPQHTVSISDWSAVKMVPYAASFEDV